MVSMRLLVSRSKSCDIQSIGVVHCIVMVLQGTRCLQTWYANRRHEIQRHFAAHVAMSCSSAPESREWFANTNAAYARMHVRTYMHLRALVRRVTDIVAHGIEDVIVARIAFRKCILCRA